MSEYALTPPRRVVVLRPPTILYKLQLLPPGHVWLVHEPIHIRTQTSPNHWSEERTEAMMQVTFTFERER